MKNIFKLLSLACLSVAFTACVEDIDTPDRGPQSNPEKEIAGTYDGTWTLTYKEGTESGEYEAQGTVDVTPTEFAYAANIAINADFPQAPKYSLEKTSAANISPLTNATTFQVYNSVTPNGFTKEVDSNDEKGNPVVLSVNTQFTGNIYPLDADGELTKGEPKSLKFVLEFKYEYIKIIMNGRRPKKLDCNETYRFVGYLNK